MVDFFIEKSLSEEQQNWLQAEWLQLMESLHFPIEQAKQIYTIFDKNFTERNRAYHNFSHIYTLLKICDTYEPHLKEAAIVKLAIWFHDAKYHPNFRDNEEKSSKLAIGQLRAYLDEEKLQKLSNFILSTTEQIPLIDNKDLLYFLDFDSLILAADPKKYQLYCDAIRNEYKNFPLFLYRLGRKRVINYYLEKENIYFVPMIQDEFEQRARTNLQWELEYL
ncbi:MAG: hypothetical protein KA974_07270 [Saprospiraceae bacterium]|nr:hypothetical protein [Saprospiraceae bacterium]